MTFLSRFTSYIGAALIVQMVFVSHAGAVVAGQIDDFEDGTTQGWGEDHWGNGSPNQPSNIPTDGPTGVNDNYLENISSGAGTAGSRMVSFNTTQWTGDYLSAGITAIRAHVKVETSSASSLSLRVGFQKSNQVGGGATGFFSSSPIVVPNDGDWHEVIFPITSSDLVATGFNFETYESTMSDVGHLRIFSSNGAKFNGDQLSATMGIDNIEAVLPPAEYQGWLWESGVEDISPTHLSEEYCFGQLDFSLNADMTWAANSTDSVCWGRTMESTGRSVFNGLPHSTEDFELQSTQPMVGAGGNLFELYGEEVIANVGQGEERLATVLSSPSDGNLLLVSQYTRFSDFGETGYYHALDQLVKSTPAIRDARTATDLENTSWRVPFNSRTALTGNTNAELTAASIFSLDLQAGGVCSFTTSAVFAPDFDHNRDIAVGLQSDNGMSFDDRAVSAGRNHNSNTACTYQIDVDNYLAVSFTLNAIDPPGPAAPTTVRFVVADDNDYLSLAPASTGVDDNPRGLQTGFLEATNMTPADLDGTYFINLNVFEFNADGVNHSMGGDGPQEFDAFGRGKVVFDSMTAGTVPTGQAGNWFACDIDMVFDEFGYEYSGSSMDSSVTVNTDQSAEDFSFTDCSFSTDADGGLRLWLELSEPGDPDPIEALFRGYVNDSFEVISLLDWYLEPDHDNSAMAVDFSSIRYILGMKYTGDPDGNEDGDEFTNYDEFKYPLAPTVPLLLRRNNNGVWHGYELNGAAIASEGGVDLTDNLFWQVQAVDDFDGNNSNDVLMRRTTNMRWHMYRMNGLEIIDEGGVFLATSPNWNIASVGDYNGDGKKDLLMRNGDNRRWRMRLMDGRTILDTGPVSLPFDLNWDVVASGDFDGDGSDDILIRNATNGRWKMALMNGITINEFTLLSFAVVDIWEFQAAADFNGDGKTDVLVRRSDNGIWRLYTMDGTTVVSQDLVALPTNANWRLEAAHDFDTDGRTDVLLRNTATEEWQLNLLGGPTVSASALLAIPANASLVLQVVDDFDFDQDADLLTRNGSNGQWKLYTIEGTAIASESVVGMTTNLAWELVSPVPQ